MATEPSKKMKDPQAEKPAKGLLEAMGDMVDKAMHSVGNMAEKTLEGVGNIAGKAVDAVGNLSGKAVDAIGNATGRAADQACEAVGEVTGKAVDSVGQIAAQTVNEVGEVTGRTVDKVGDQITYLGEGVCEGIANVADSMINTSKFMTSSQYRREVGYPWLQGIIHENWSKVKAELHESEEMLLLIWKYAHGKKLTPEESKMVKEQLMDIVRVIPALGIFALPGGAILLPILARALPWRLTPSAFQEKVVSEYGHDALKEELDPHEEIPMDESSSAEKS